MDGELTSLPGIRTEGIAPAVPKKDGGQRQRRAFERHLRGEDEGRQTEETPPPSEEPPRDEPPPPPGRKPGSILDFEA